MRFRRAPARLSRLPRNRAKFAAGTLPTVAPHALARGRVLKQHHDSFAEGLRRRVSTMIRIGSASPTADMLADRAIAPTSFSGNLATFRIGLSKEEHNFEVADDPQEARWPCRRMMRQPRDGMPTP